MQIAIRKIDPKKKTEVKAGRMLAGKKEHRRSMFLQFHMISCVSL